MAKRITILGAGESGVGAAILAKKRGCEIFVSDHGKIGDAYREKLKAQSINFEEEQHTISRILETDEVIKSPGISENASIVKKIRKAGIPVISEIEFAFRYSKAKIIAITGTNGKTTTTLLTYHLLKEGGLDVGLAGNVGSSFAGQLAEDSHEYYVLELSSFQLDGIKNFKSHVSVLLNITSDHLDRYNNRLINYIRSKFRVVKNLTSKDYFIYFLDDKTIRRGLRGRRIAARKLQVSLEKKVKNGAYLDGDKLEFRLNDDEWSLPTEQVSLKGKHNMINTMAAVLTALSINVGKEDIAQSTKTFSNAPHRLEQVDVINGVRFINDSKATNVQSVYYALDCIKAPIVWIAGGVDKGNDYDQIMVLILEKVRSVVFLGKDNDKLWKAFSGIKSRIMETESINEAVAIAHSQAEPGDTVLLSPACASFDLFENYIDRCNQFKTAVRNLKREISENKLLVL